jgi:ribose transport system ATP-binding protein
LSNNDECILEMKNITKEFPGVVALRNVSFSLKKGEIHCLVGENGAGKSTLIKILAGAIKPDSGEIFINGEKKFMNSIHDVQTLGISFVFQEINVVNQLTVSDNITLGREIKNFGFLNKKRNVELAQEYLGDLKIEINPKIKVGDLSVAMKQVIGIAKALSTSPSLIVMDEPSASMSEKELNILFDILKKLKEKQVSVIYISHRIDEIFRLGDRVTILRDGEVIDTKAVKDIDRKDLVQLMIGKQFKEIFPDKSKKFGNVILKLNNIENKLLKDINLLLREGEILGVAGLRGSGRTELARIIFGADRPIKGDMFINNKKKVLLHPRNAIINNIGLVPEERRTQGIIGILSLKDNIALPSYNKVSKYGFINSNKLGNIAKEYIKEMSIKTPSDNQKVMFLSGGNQQKVVLAKWLFTDSNILILDEPTRGIDVGAKFEIFNIIIDLAKKGRSIIILSSELDELIGLSNRIIVLNKGRISGELTDTDINQSNIMHLIS